MTSFLYGLILYMVSFFVFFSNLDPLMFWILMELNLVSFVSLLSMEVLDSKGFLKSLELGLFYFLVQSLGSMVFLFSICLSDSAFLFSSFLFWISISLKIGIFPLFFWIFYLGSSLGSLSFSLILTFQKVPMFLVLFNFNSFFNFVFISLSLVSGSFLIFNSFSLVPLLISSSISSSIWVFLFFSIDLNLYFFYFSVYSLVVFLLVYSLKLNPCSLGIIEILSFAFLGGLPPMSFFFFKFMIFNTLPLSNFWIFLFIWFFSIFCLLGYTKFFFKSFFHKISPYYTQKICKKKSFMVVMGSGFLPLFYVY